MSNLLNQQNKEKVWDFWQKLNHVGVENVPDVIRNAVHDDVDWNGSAPIDQIVGAEGLISDFWLPLLHSFPDLKRAPYVFMGGIESGETHWAGEVGSEWVTSCGYLTGTFVNDWLGIPATGKKTNIHFGQFYVLREGKIAESYVQYDILAVMRQAGYQVLPPAPGAEGGKVPGPVAKDGVLLTEQDPLESRKTLQLVEAMGQGLGALRAQPRWRRYEPYGARQILASGYEMVWTQWHRRLFHPGGIRRFPSAPLASRLRRSRSQP